MLDHYDHILDDDTHPLREGQRQLRPIVDRLVASDNPNTAPAVHALLGAIGRQRKQKANPEVAPLHNDVKQHQIFSKSDLLRRPFTDALSLSPLFCVVLSPPSSSCT